ncbi:Bug family tripartite tricarboxylate transporter substrate binding protein [Variovorax terrae]|uniref:Tripartite tricarboxylate transporter substrate binding protein n=1 Tax=Variovorax terrae TaxID=2923278 RepID=A0A9X1W0S6_9BURK|nr:tripartite tricarboxylate transporter substrate binding protein [Variovorax terrae]
MKLIKRRAALAAAFCALQLVHAAPAQADWKPDHPIRLIVPFAPGAATDISARTISDHLAAALGQPVVIDNQGAASGTVGTAAAARAAPDGYTWVLAHDPPFTILPHVRKLGYDPLKDFEPVALIATIPMVLVVRPGLPVNSIRELIDAARTRPGQMTIASSGTGATSHLAAELFKYETQTNILHVPYKGQAQGVTDVLGGQVDMIFSSFGPVVQHIRSGRLKALGISVPKRYASLPEVPTIAESGVPGFDFSVWTGIAVPAGTPQAIRDTIAAAVAKALQVPEVRARFDGLGFVPGDGDPQALRRKIQGDYAKWKQVIHAARIQIE